MDKAKAWVNELQRQADPNIVIALAGNKSDLGARRAIETKASQVVELVNLFLLLGGSRICRGIRFVVF